MKKWTLALLAPLRLALLQEGRHTLLAVWRLKELVLQVALVSERLATDNPHRGEKSPAANQACLPWRPPRPLHRLDFVIMEHKTMYHVRTWCVIESFGLWAVPEA